MSEVETLGILDEIEALVSDKLQVVSYKWLSRNFLVPSNTAKRLLQEFVDKHQDGLEVVYSLSGWLKENPLNYHIRLVPGPKLAEAKQEFNGCCSVQVYSVQTCIPNDPATLWNAEFIQTEELFSQPATVENCLRDNRFGGISSSFVRRGADGNTGNNAVAFSTSTHQRMSTSPAEPKKVQQTSQKVGHQSLNVVKDVKNETLSLESENNQDTKPCADKGKVTSLPSDKKIGQNSKSTSAAGGSLANLWGRASTKSKDSKPVSGAPVTTNTIQDSTGGADAQISAYEAAEVKSDDEDMSFRRASNGEVGRKRKVVFDLSDEENEFEDIISLASPELPKAKSLIDSKVCTKTSAIESNTHDEPKQVRVKVEKEKPVDKEPRQPFQEDISSLKGNTKSSASSSEGKQESLKLESSGKMTKTAPSSPKRKKVLKTRIDERGREVTEVVWEGEETKKNGDSTTNEKKGGNEPAPDKGNRPIAAKKSPAVAAAAPKSGAAGGKAGNKKGAGAKDPKQGNIMSFFKRV